MGGCIVEPDVCHFWTMPKVLVDRPLWIEQWRMLLILHWQAVIKWVKLIVRMTEMSFLSYKVQVFGDHLKYHGWTFNFDSIQTGIHEKLIAVTLVLNFLHYQQTIFSTLHLKYWHKWGVKWQTLQQDSFLNWQIQSFFSPHQLCTMICTWSWPQILISSNSSLKSLVVTLFVVLFFCCLI